MKKKLLCNSKIIGEINIADTFSTRLLGYMFQKRPHHNYLLITPCNSIHTFFMKFEIDVLFLDKNMRVIRILKALKPGKIIMPMKLAKTVVEAPSGKLNGFEIGDEVRILSEELEGNIH